MYQHIVKWRVHVYSFSSSCSPLLHSHKILCYIEVMILCGCAFVLLCNGFSWLDCLRWKIQWSDLRAQNRYKTHKHKHISIWIVSSRSETSKQQNLVKSRIQWSLRTKGDERSLIHANETMFTGFFFCFFFFFIIFFSLLTSTPALCLYSFGLFSALILPAL